MSAPGSRRLDARPDPSAPRVATSILSTDLALLAQDVTAAMRAGADWVHVDVLDDHPLPMGRPAMRRGGGVLDVHLLVKPADALVRALASAGADLVSFHPEECECVHRTMRLVKDHGCRVGIALNSSTPLAEIDELLGELDAVVVTSVGDPGSHGLDASALARIRAVSDRISATGRRIVLQVDGGVRPENVGALVRAGADVLVACPAFFGPGDCAAALAALDARPVRRPLAVAPGGVG